MNQEGGEKRATPSRVETLRLVIIGVLTLLAGLPGYYFHTMLQTEIVYTHFIYFPIVPASM